MIKEAKDKLNSIISLSNRMDKNTKILSEGINEDAQAQNKLSVKYEIRKVGDPNTKSNVVVVIIHPLFQQDALRLGNIEPFKSDNGRHTVITKDLGDGRQEYRFVFGRTIISNRGKATKKVDANAENAGETTNAQAAQTASINPILQSLGLTEALNLASLMANATPKQEEGGEDSEHANEGMYKVLKPCFDAIANFLGNTNRYSESSINSLHDFETIYDIYLSRGVVKDTVYPDVSSDKIAEEMMKALKSGNWQSLMRNTYNPLDLESLIFGKTLSARNKQLIANVVKQYGYDNIQDPLLPNYSSEFEHLHAPGEWRRFGRKVVANPSHPVPVEVPMVGHSAGTRRAPLKALQDAGEIDDKYHGYMAKAANFGNVGANTRYERRFLYPLSDTEPIDPTSTKDYFEDIPGIKNNWWGGLNQKALDLKNKISQDISTELTPEEKQTIKDVESEDGKAAIFNEALMAFANYNKQYAPLVKDISNENNKVIAYINNVKAIAEAWIQGQGYANPDIINVAKDIFTFGVACFTIGTDEVGASSRYNLRDEYKKAVVDVNSGLENIINFINHQLNLRYEPLREKVQEIIASNMGGNANAQQAQAQPAQVPQDAAEMKNVSESIESYDLGTLLKEIKEFYGQ